MKGEKAWVGSLLEYAWVMRNRLMAWKSQVIDKTEDILDL